MARGAFEFTINKHIANIGEPSSTGWQTELNIVTWGDKPKSYDIRAWSPDHSKCGKGKTFTESELIALKEILENLDITAEISAD